jgi:hypothetical protein
MRIFKVKPNIVIIIETKLFKLEYMKLENLRNKSQNIMTKNITAQTNDSNTPPL